MVSESPPAKMQKKLSNLPNKATIEKTRKTILGLKDQHDFQLFDDMAQSNMYHDSLQ